MPDAGRLVPFGQAPGGVVGEPGRPAERIGGGGDPAERVVLVEGAAAERVGDRGEVAAVVVGVAGGVAERVGRGDDPPRGVAGELPAAGPVGDGHDAPGRVVGADGGAAAGDVVAHHAAGGVAVEGLDEACRGDPLDEQPVGVVPQLPPLPGTVHQRGQPPTRVVQVTLRAPRRRLDARERPAAV